MILLIPLSDLLQTYEHVEPVLADNHLSLKEFISTAVTVLDKVETSDSRTYASHPSYYFDLTTPLSEFDQKIQQLNPTNCYEELDAAMIHHQLTALALEVYYELVNSMAVYKVVDHPMLYRSVIGWQGQNMLLKVCRRI